MDNSRPDTRSKIIETAIDMIGRQINLNFTIREIAEKANVNLASVNYYFRSKENLISEVEQHFTHETQLTYDLLNDAKISPKKRIENWAENMMEKLIEYPGIIFLMVTKLISDGNQKAGIADLIDNSEYNLTPIIKEITGITDDLAVSIKAMQLFSGVITPVLFYHGAGRTFKVDIRNSEDRLKYIRSLVESIL